MKTFEQLGSAAGAEAADIKNIVIGTLLRRLAVLLAAGTALVLISPRTAHSFEPAQTVSVHCLLSRTDYKGNHAVWVNQAPLPLIQYGSEQSIGVGSLNLKRVTATASVIEPDKPAALSHLIELKIIDRQSGQIATAEGVIDFAQLQGYSSAAGFSNREDGKRVDYRLSCVAEPGDKF